MTVLPPCSRVHGIPVPQAELRRLPWQPGAMQIPSA